MIVTNDRVTTPVTAKPKRCSTCGQKHRSAQEHNTLFGVIGMSFDQWPETHNFKPDDPDHLRAWLLIEANHCETFEVPSVLNSDPQSVAELGKFFCGGKRHFRLRQHGDGIIIVRPKSLKKDETPVVEYRAVASRIYDIIEHVTTITPGVYKREKGKAA